MTVLVLATMGSTAARVSINRIPTQYLLCFFSGCSDLFGEKAFQQIDENFPPECLVI